MIELMNFCMNSDMTPIMIFFNQHLGQDDVPEEIFQSDFMEQKAVSIGVLVKVIKVF